METLGADCVCVIQMRQMSYNRQEIMYQPGLLLCLSFLEVLFLPFASFLVAIFPSFSKLMQKRDDSNHKTLVLCSAVSQWFSTTLQI